MIYTVTNLPAEINFAPTEIESILQNCRMILSTFQKSVPLFREFGIDSTSIDSPLNIAKTKLAAEISTQLNKYESRAVLKKIEVDGDLHGRLKITAAIEV